MEWGLDGHLGPCRNCGAQRTFRAGEAIAAGAEVALVGELIVGAPAKVDLQAMQICALTTHVLEGRLVGRHLAGRCARCGVGILTDGSS